MFLSGKSLLEFWVHLQGVFSFFFFQFNRSQRKDFNTETPFKLRFYLLYGSHGPPVLLDHHASEQGWRSECSFTGQRWVERKFCVGTCQTPLMNVWRATDASHTAIFCQSVALTGLYWKLSIISNISAHQNTTITCDFHFPKLMTVECGSMKSINNDTVEKHHIQTVAINSRFISKRLLFLYIFINECVEGACPWWQSSLTFEGRL